MYRQLINLFIASSERFVESQKALILSGVSERCLCGSLMTYVRYALDQSEFRHYHADIEYNRNFDGRIKTIIDERSTVINITCDLIVHSRGENTDQDNLIAIEMKKDTHTEEVKNNDRKRLRALTKGRDDANTYSADGRTLPENVCGYLIGVYYEICIAQRIIKIEYYREGEYKSSFTRRF